MDRRGSPRAGKAVSERMEPATQVARPRPPRTRKTAPTTPKAPVPAPRATRPWLLSTAAARRPRRPSPVVELDLQEERPPARNRDARFPRGATDRKNGR